MICTPNTGHPVLGVHIKTEKQKLPHKNTVRQLLLFICCVPCVCRQFRSALFLLCERAFLPAAFVARLSREWPFVLPKSRTLPGKKHRKTASAIYSAVSYRFYNVFAKKALQMNFKNILYNYRFNFFTQIVSYRFVWGSRVCAFCTASALR